LHEIGGAGYALQARGQTAFKHFRLNGIIPAPVACCFITSKRHPIQCIITMLDSA
jgi:hypothetical protein